MPSLSPAVEFAWQIAAAEAMQARYEFIEPGHLFIGLCSVEKVFAPEVQQQQLPIPNDVIAALRAEWNTLVALFNRAGAEPSALRRKLRELLGPGASPDQGPRKMSRSAGSRAVFTRALVLAQQGGASAVSLTHLLAALLEDENGAAPALLKQQGVDVPALRAAAAACPAAASAGQPAKPPASYLSRFGRDLTQLAREGKVRECIGRRDEMLQMVRTLSRETKNNPVLVGEAGVGKSAIVEGLAWRIAQGKSLPGKRIIQLQIAGLVAGAKYRGEFEERLQATIREVSQSPDVILFLDEIHTLVGAGDSAGGLDAANIMKPALARGELRCIGATTLSEYRKYIEKDPALERRFQPITVSEPSLAQTREILVRGYKERFEEKHKVTIEIAAVDAAVTLSARYLPDRRLPDTVDGAVHLLHATVQDVRSSH